jgi:hypothetical protein
MRWLCASRSVSHFTEAGGAPGIAYLEAVLGDSLDRHHRPVMADIAALAPEARMRPPEQPHPVADRERHLVLRAVLIRGLDLHLVPTQRASLAPPLPNGRADGAGVCVRGGTDGERIALAPGIRLLAGLPEIGSGRDRLAPAALHQHRVPVVAQAGDALGRVAPPEQERGFLVAVAALAKPCCACNWASFNAWRCRSGFRPPLRRCGGRARS